MVAGSHITGHFSRFVSGLIVKVWKVKECVFLPAAALGGGAGSGLAWEEVDGANLLCEDPTRL